ncbi:creatinine amidohydrolase [Palleronia aestuarii]|uniref:Creatinine amidohydrolase n=1 Tax=Palleronia aestuarii TaxID=568105 RepID=A0A2W7NUG1_9RHOB|nr:creatininase family protein [Palleronia aestuarii]PZX14872.1 creatinine amidohydrolase [Palleronia aestuarii]
MKYALQDMTVAEFRDRLPENPVILLPLGSQEVQGPHCPMGDFALTADIADAVAQRSGAVTAPCLPFGCAEFFRPFPGGMQLRAPTFRAVIRDMVEAFLDHGLDRVLILNGHSSNAPLIDETLRDIRRASGIAVPSIDLWRSIPSDLWTRLHGERAHEARGHGGDPITSVCMYLHPERMRPDLATPSVRAAAFGLPTVGAGGVLFDGATIALPLDADEVNPDGMMGGDPALASAEIGRAIFEHLVDHCARFVTHLAERDPRDPMGTGAR